MLYGSQDLREIVENGYEGELSQSFTTTIKHIKGESQEGQEGSLFYLPSSRWSYFWENSNDINIKGGMGYSQQSIRRWRKDKNGETSSFKRWIWFT